MTKIQLAAKAVWNGLLICAAGRMLSWFVVMNPAIQSVGWSEVFIFITMCLLSAVFIGLLTNFKIPLRLTGDTNIFIESDSIAFFATIQRLVFIFAGLCIGVGFPEGIEKMAVLVVKFLPSIQLWISQWVAGDISKAFETSFNGLRAVFYPVGYVLFCVYLLLGADRLVQWQITLLKRFAVKEHAHE
jgi:hypothetical protein